MGYLNTINLDGGDQQVVYAVNRAQSDPDWSPDGKQIVFVLHTHVYFSISVIEAEGGVRVQLTRPVHNESNGTPDWSPDGQQIVFSSDRDGDDEIYVMDADGNNVQQLTNNGTNDRRPAWSPNG
jgi:Tol biopolymer transport system component